MVGVLLLVRPGASALCCVPPAHPPSLDPPFDGGDGEGEGEGTRRRGALGPRRPPSVLPPLREPSAPRRSSPRSSIVHAAPPSGPPSGRRPHPSSALLFPPVSRFQSSRALADSRRPLLSLLPTAVISPTSPRAMSNAPPSDALSEGSYWIAELSGVPAGVAIDHVRPLSPSRCWTVLDARSFARSCRSRLSPGASSTARSGSPRKKPTSAQRAFNSSGRLQLRSPAPAPDTCGPAARSDSRTGTSCSSRCTVSTESRWQSGRASSGRP